MRKALSAGVIALVLGFGVSSATADETPTETAENTIGDAKTDVKKRKRAVKRKSRDLRDEESVLKDAQDRVSDLGDDASNEATKAKRKVD